MRLMRFQEKQQRKEKRCKISSEVIQAGLETAPALHQGVFCRKRSGGWLQETERDCLIRRHTFVYIYIYDYMILCIYIYTIYILYIYASLRVSIYNFFKSKICKNRMYIFVRELLHYSRPLIVFVLYSQYCSFMLCHVFFIPVPCPAGCQRFVQSTAWTATVRSWEGKQKLGALQLVFVVCLKLFSRK